MTVGRSFLAALVALATSAPVAADTIVAARTIRAQALIGPDDITTVDTLVPGALQVGDAVIGLEARVVLYAGRPIRPGDIGPPAIVERNQVVALVYRQGGLTILAEGRALGRGGIGDRLRIMNLSSRTTVSGEVLGDGSVMVGPTSDPQP